MNWEPAGAQVDKHACLTPCPATFAAMSEASCQHYESSEYKYRFRVLTIAVI